MYTGRRLVAKGRGTVELAEGWDEEVMRRASRVQELSSVGPGGTREGGGGCFGFCWRTYRVLQDADEWSIDWNRVAQSILLPALRLGIMPCASWLPATGQESRPLSVLLQPFLFLSPDHQDQGKLLHRIRIFGAAKNDPDADCSQRAASFETTRTPRIPPRPTLEVVALHRFLINTHAKSRPVDAGFF